MTYRLKTPDGVETFYAMSEQAALELTKAAALEYGWAYLQNEHGVTHCWIHGLNATDRSHALDSCR